MFSSAMNGAENEWGIHSSHPQPAPTALPEERLLLHWAHSAGDVYGCVRHSQVRTADLSHLTCWAWDLTIWLLLSIVSLNPQLAHRQSCAAIACGIWCVSSPSWRREYGSRVSCKHFALIFYSRRSRPVKHQPWSDFLKDHHVVCSENEESFLISRKKVMINIFISVWFLLLLCWKSV